MQYIMCKQGTPEWLQARAGSITASMFAIAISMVGGLSDQQQRYVDAIRSGATEEVAAEAGGYKTKVKRTETVERAILGIPIGEPSDASKKYAGEIALERIAGSFLGEPPRAWVLERGHELETVARRLYEQRTDQMVVEAGICKSDDGWFGYSSDGLVERDGSTEIKCPVDPIKIFNILRTGDVSEYIHQMQGGMWITGRQWCDFIMYVPALASIGNDLYVKRIYRDEAFIAGMVNSLMDFKRQVQRLESFARNFKQ